MQLVSLPTYLRLNISIQKVLGSSSGLSGYISCNTVNKSVCVSNRRGGQIFARNVWVLAVRQKTHHWNTGHINLWDTLVGTDRCREKPRYQEKPTCRPSDHIQPHTFSPEPGLHGWEARTLTIKAAAQLKDSLKASENKRIFVFNPFKSTLRNSLPSTVASR